MYDFRKRRSLIGEYVASPQGKRLSRNLTTCLADGQSCTRCRGEARLVLAPDVAQGSAGATPSLTKAVARPDDWVQRIARGEMPSQRNIATETGLHRRYVGRIIQMAFLALDITEAILEDRQPPHMTLDTLIAHMPADWVGQRKQLLTSYHPTA
mgnify:CR=1 FL=1